MTIFGVAEIIDLDCCTVLHQQISAHLMCYLVTRPGHATPHFVLRTFSQLSSFKSSHTPTFNVCHTFPSRIQLLSGNLATRKLSYALGWPQMQQHGIKACRKTLTLSSLNHS